MVMHSQAIITCFIESRMEVVLVKMLIGVCMLRVSAWA